MSTQNFNNKYERLKHELETGKTGKMKCFGYSMLPILQSGSLLTFVVEDAYAVDDIVFCKVKGRYIDAHKVTQVDAQKGYLISNNKGHDNGWTKIVYGRVSEAITGGKTKLFEQKKLKKEKKMDIIDEQLIDKPAKAIYEMLCDPTQESIYPPQVKSFTARTSYLIFSKFPELPVFDVVKQVRERVEELRAKDYMRK